MTNAALKAKLAILAEYDVENAIIRNPGKFEGEPIWVPYFWNLVLEGGGEDIISDWPDDVEDPVIEGTMFTVDSDESEAFGLECGTKVSIRCDSQGFVIGEVL